MVIGPRIKLARAKARMSLRQLAELAGVSPAAVSKFERGEVEPRQSTLLRLAKALSVNPEYFFRETRVEAIAPTYRKHSKLSRREQQAIEAAVVESVERYLTAEELFPDGFFPETKLPRIEIDGVQEAEEAAGELRQQWDIGSDPIEDICGRLENRGVKVIDLEGPDGFDGFSCFVNQEVPVIVFNNTVPGDRQRFDLAHELGHLVLDIESPEVDIEKAAHRFAAAFLVPPEAARNELGKKRSNLSFDELMLLKQEYGFSMQAWIRRAYDLEIIDQTTYAALFRRLSAQGWRSQEPGDVPQEKPRRLKLLIHQALSERLITPSYAATLLEAPRSGRPGVFNKSLEQSAEDLTGLYTQDKELTVFTEANLGEIIDDHF